MKLALTQDGLLEVTAGTIDTRGVGHLIEALARCRMAMQPEVPVTVNPITLAPHHAPGMFAGLRKCGAMTLALRHPGLGWVSFELPADSVRRLRELL